MNKNTIVSFIILILFLALAILPQVQSISPKFEINDNNSIITGEDEGSHYPCGYEIWFYHTQLTFEDGQKWDAAATFVYFMNKTAVDEYTPGGSFIRNRLWNRQTGEWFDYFRTGVFPGEFNTSKNEINLTYYNCSGKGLFPDYHYYIDDDDHNIKTDLYFHATSSPCWLAQESMNRIIPWGFSGYGSAYFIPVIEVEGKVSVNGTTYNATGFGYFEHDFTYCNFENPFAIYSLKEFGKCVRQMGLYARWWLKQIIINRPRIIPSWHQSSDYLFGWIWNWYVFEHNCSIVIFRPTIYWKSGGIIPVLLYFSEDGENYAEVGCVYWRNIREKYIERAGIYIPLEFELIARKGKLKIFLRYNTTTGVTELFKSDWVEDYKTDSCTFYCCGNVTGHYENENGKVILDGFGAVEQSRSLPKPFKHRSREIDFIIPPNGIGFTFRKRSHWTGLERFIKVQIRPYLDIELYIKRIPRT